MYVNPFLAGVITTILVEACLVLIGIARHLND